MRDTVSRLTDRGRRFLNKHVLRQPVVPPARPQTAAPRNNSPARPLAPAPAQRPGSALPRDGLAIPHDGVYSGLPDRSQVSNDSPEERSHVELMATDPAGDDSPEELASYETLPTTSETTGESTSVPDHVPLLAPSNYTTLMQLQEAASNSAAGRAFQFLSESSSESNSEEELDVEEKYGAKQHAKIDEAATPTGMKAKPVGAEYAGEHNKAAWRGTTPEAAEQTHVATRLFTEQEQQQNELVMGKDGQFTKDGRSVAGQSLGYVMDASGRMVAFKETDNQIATTDMDGNTTKEDTSDGPAILAGRKRRLRPNQRLETIHHSSVLGGDAVVGEDGEAALDAKGKPILRSRPAASAGFVKFDYFGKIITISNSSGHYKPSVDYLAQAIEHLLKQGAFFKNEVTDADGKRLKRNSKEAQLYAATQAKLTEAGHLAERVAGLTEALAAAEENQDEEAQAALDTRLKEAAGKLDALKKKVDEAKTVLGKLGVGPSNRVRQEVQASYLDVKPGMTGAAIRAAPTRTMPAYTFLKTGGGNSDQAALKMDLVQEILSLRRFSRADHGRMTELGKKEPDALSDKEAKELVKLSKRWKIAENAIMADKEATRRSEAGTGGAAAIPNVEAALAKLGVPLRDEDSSSSESDSDSESESESTSF